MDNTFSQDLFSNLPGLGACALAARVIRHCQPVVDANTFEFQAIGRIASLAETLAAGGDIGLRESLDARKAIKIDRQSFADFRPLDHALFAADWAACCITFAGRSTGYAVFHAANAAVCARPECEEAIRQDIETLLRLCKERNANDDSPFPLSDFVSI